MYIVFQYFNVEKWSCLFLLYSPSQSRFVFVLILFVGFFVFCCIRKPLSFSSYFGRLFFYFYFIRFAFVVDFSCTAQIYQKQRREKNDTERERERQQLTETQSVEQYLLKHFDCYMEVKYYVFCCCSCFCSFSICSLKITDRRKR